MGQVWRAPNPDWQLEASGNPEYGRDIFQAWQRSGTHRMNIHKNARLTPKGRERLVNLVKSGLILAIAAFRPHNIQNI